MPPLAISICSTDTTTYPKTSCNITHRPSPEFTQLPLFTENLETTDRDSQNEEIQTPTEESKALNDIPCQVYKSKLT